MIAWFLKENSGVVKQSKFKAWHEKHQIVFPWLTYACVTHLRLVFAILEYISSHCDNHETLTVGNNLPHENH